MHKIPLLSAALLTLWTNTSWAQSVGTSSFDYVQFLPLVAIFGIFYFLLIRPQQKKMKQHKEMLGNIRRGDRVVTAGGIIATIKKVESDSELLVDIGNGVEVKVVRSTVSQVLDKTAPVTTSGATSSKTTKDSTAKKKSSGKPVTRRTTKTSRK